MVARWLGGWVAGWLGGWAAGQVAGWLGGWMTTAPPHPTPSPPLTGTGPKVVDENCGYSLCSNTEESKRSKLFHCECKDVNKRCATRTLGFALHTRLVMS